MIVTIRTAGLPAGLRVEVQIHAICARNAMSFATPLLLLGLLLLPLLVLGYVLDAAAAGALRRPLHEPRRARERRREHALMAPPPGLAVFLLALTALLVGFARPKMTRMADREEATIVLVIDVSGSMSAKDVKPTRLEAAQEVVREFLGDLPKKFQVGVVSFSEQAEVRHARRRTTATSRPTRSTTSTRSAARRSATGSRAASRSREPPRRTGRPGTAPAAILLLSDGSQTEGLLLPLEGAARAKSFGIPIYTIALGTPEGVVEFNRFGGDAGSSPCRPIRRRSGRSPRRPAAASTRRRASATCARPTSGSARS